MLREKKLVILILMYDYIVYEIWFFHRSTSLLEYYRQRDRYHLCWLFQSYHILEETFRESCTIFWLVVSNNWFVIHESRTLNSISDYVGFPNVPINLIINNYDNVINIALCLSFIKRIWCSWYMFPLQWNNVNSPNIITEFVTYFLASLE